MVVEAKSLFMPVKATDETLEKRAAEIERKVDTYRSILETAMEGFWVTDAKGRIIVIRKQTSKKGVWQRCVIRNHWRI